MKLEKVRCLLYNYTHKEVFIITIQQKIDMACAYSGITKAELARRIGTNINAFSQRLKTGKFSDEDFNKIAKAVGAEYYSCFRFPDGKEV